MVKRQLRTIAKSMQTLHKKSSDTYKKSRDLDEKAEKEFWELVVRVAEKYNCKILLEETNYMADKISNSVLFKDEWNNRNEIGLDCMYNTSFNGDFEGEFNIGLLGNLTVKQINEIRNLTGTVLAEEIIEANGFYSYYAFFFDFDNYWNEGFQR